LLLRNQVHDKTLSKSKGSYLQKSCYLSSVSQKRTAINHRAKILNNFQANQHFTNEELSPPEEEGPEAELERIIKDLVLNQGKSIKSYRSKISTEKVNN
jgi:hypothetical protein